MCRRGEVSRLSFYQILHWTSHTWSAALKPACYYWRREGHGQTYGEFEKEMGMFVKAFVKWDDGGRWCRAAHSVFRFRMSILRMISPGILKRSMRWWKWQESFSTPYFSNFLNSDLFSEDIRSMCCRLRLDNRELEEGEADCLVQTR